MNLTSDNQYKTSSFNMREKASQKLRSIFPFFLFFLAFLPRVLYQSTIYTVWHDRAELFMEAVSKGDWYSTLLSPHPGVTTMWLVGLAQQVASLINSEFTKLPANEQMDIELIPLAFVIALMIVIAYFLLGKIFDWQVALVSTSFLALDPYHISLSQAVHVDALASVFIMVAALFLLVFLQHRQWRWIIFSGLCTALSLLTKTPSFFLVPYFLLVTTVSISTRTFINREGADVSFWRKIWIVIKTVSGSFIVWLAVIAITYVILWPSMWVQPLFSLNISFTGTNIYRENPHPFPTFFLGVAGFEDPGPLFYPINMAVKTTAVTFIGFLLSFVVLFDRQLNRQKRLAIIYGLLFVFFFALMMTLGAKKFSRYALPALQFVTLWAGVGFVYFLRKITKGKSSYFAASIAFILLYQAAVSLPRHPNYGTHYNYLFGGPKVVLESNILAGQEKIEGFENAAEYLNNLPLSQLLVVGAQDSGSFYRFFGGKTVELSDEKVDYLVFTRNAVMRGLDSDPWQAIWQKYQEKEPNHVVEFDGVPYVWIYKASPEINTEKIIPIPEANVGKDFRLFGYEFEPSTAKPGDTVRLTLYWEALNKPTEDWTVFTHLIDSDGQLVAQKDNPPQGGKYPTHLWQKGQQIKDVYELLIPMEASEGDYRFTVGMYSPETFERLPIAGSSETKILDNRIILPGPSITVSAP